MKNIFSVLLVLLITVSAFCQDITLLREKELAFKHGISYGSDVNSEIKCVFANEKVINLSIDSKNNRNLGIYIETLVTLNYNFKVVPFTDEIYIIYSNLSKIQVNKDQILNFDIIMGYGGGEGANIYNDSDFHLYIYTKK